MMLLFILIMLLYLMILILWHSIGKLETKQKELIEELSSSRHRIGRLEIISEKLHPHAGIHRARPSPPPDGDEDGIQDKGL